MTVLRRRVFACAIVLAAGWSAAGGAQAHPFHATFAELRHNPKTHRLEVALRVAPADLERALRRRVRAPISLERRPDIDTLIEAYVRDVFVVQHNGSAVPLRWVGKEVLSHQIAWLYFEFLPPTAAAAVTLRNSAFFELASKQINTVQVTSQQGTRTLTFSPGRREQSRRVRLGPPKSRGPVPTVSG
ncbi:MAG: hypothetical protein B7733_04265 [Myxococcales bacterium FL481]|nr:MAG: hypothetical protein B7733_04265 [Myxococcales bacterium FL481]